MTTDIKTGGPLAAFRRRVEAGALRHDPMQELAAEKLQSLYNALKNYEPRTKGSWKERFGLARRIEEPPAGLYIYGDVGRGKSMLMDLFFETVPITAKRRVHFHAFMLEVHDTLHQWRQKGREEAVDEMLPALGAHIAKSVTVLCFDEFHVTNIADAMLLGRLFEALLEHGVIVVATSNWAPDDLYEGGLQRDLFLPFIAMLKAKLDVLHLVGATDYRLQRLMSMKVYHVPNGPASDKALANAFARLTDDAAGQPASLTVKGRIVPVSKAAKGVACFTFADLCENPLGAADYIEIANAYHTVILSGIPRLKPEQRNEAKRFATLIDSLYERKTKLVVSADGAPQDLYAKGKHAFEFQRTVSRLMEMQSAEYLGDVAA